MQLKMPSGIRTVTGRTSYSIFDDPGPQIIRTQRKFLMPNYTQMEMKLAAQYAGIVRIPFALLRNTLADKLFKK